MKSFMNGSVTNRSKSASCAKAESSLNSANTTAQVPRLPRAPIPSPQSPAPINMHRGKLVILLMVVVGCAMGGMSIAFHHWLARRAIAWWGRANVELITEAPRVDAIRLRSAAASETDEVVTID